ncbi:hypothetical protein FKM82_017628 [Ascaphus truei]
MDHIGVSFTYRHRSCIVQRRTRRFLKTLAPWDIARAGASGKILPIPLHVACFLL